MKSGYLVAAYLLVWVFIASGLYRPSVIGLLAFNAVFIWLFVWGKRNEA